ncbi:YitT family protein [Ruminococcus gauvreauii]|uniref:YitT family protein n=2 Tax=Ruminococcus gauvreauii TaxID=438033 RepID=A0ABY5VLK0_9FIRM|nr:YitT family protein [Ruminococcus gauvreauii]UWP61192.1 YitT family protein [Ruminococcus gauvreauii]
MGAGKLVVIITNKSQEAAEEIGKISGRGSTAIQAMGTYTKQKKNVLLCACSSSQAYLIRNVVHRIDPGAFVMLTETSEVYGEGYIHTKV